MLNLHSRSLNCGFAYIVFDIVAEFLACYYFGSYDNKSMSNKELFFWFFVAFYLLDLRSMLRGQSSLCPSSPK